MMTPKLRALLAALAVTGALVGGGATYAASGSGTSTTTTNSSTATTPTTPSQNQSGNCPNM